MTSKINHDIKRRKEPKNVFITPIPLAMLHISFIDPHIGDVWYDPFRGSGSYYNHFPKHTINRWSEILDGRDFYQFTEKVDVICSNPPYSEIDRVLQKSVELKPRVISYLLGINNITTRRIEYMEKSGYFITKLHLCKVFKWFGMSCIVVWEKDKTGIISYDRKVWHSLTERD